MVVTSWQTKFQTLSRPQCLRTGSGWRAHLISFPVSLWEKVTSTYINTRAKPLCNMKDLEWLGATQAQERLHFFFGQPLASGMGMLNWNGQELLAHIAKSRGANFNMEMVSLLPSSSTGKCAIVHEDFLKPKHANSFQPANQTSFGVLCVFKKKTDLNKTRCIRIAKVSMITQNVYPNTHKPKRLWTRLFAEIGVVLLVGQKILTWVGSHVGNSFVGIAVANRNVKRNKSIAMVQVTLQMPQKYADIRKHLKTLRYTYNEYKYNLIV